jgi:pilus assembly protein CpaF
MAAPELPMWFIRRQIANAVQIVVQTARLSGGARKIVQISEITGLQGDSVSMHDIFQYEQTGLNDDMEVQGHFQATGIRPQVLARLQRCGVEMPLSAFERGRREIDRMDAFGVESRAL